MGYNILGHSTKKKKKKQKLEHDGRLYMEDEKITDKQDDKHNGNDTATQTKMMLKNSAVKHYESEGKCTVSVEVYKEITEEIEKHDSLDEPEKVKRGDADNHLDRKAETKDTASVSIQTDLDMFGIELIESKIKELSKNITNEQRKLSIEWKKGIHRTRDDIQDDKVIANIEFAEIEYIKYKLEELEIKLNVFFDKNFDKTVSLLEKITELYNEIDKHKDWEKTLSDELNNKRIEIREAKLELKEKKEEIKETKLELKEEKDIHKNLKQEIVATRDEINETKHKLSAIKEKYRAQEITTTKQADDLNAMITVVETLKCQQAARVRQELPTVTELHGGPGQYVEPSQKNKIGCDGETKINEMITEEFDIGDQEREFDDLMQFPIQESEEEEEETELKKYVMDEMNFSGRYDFYLRQFEDLGLFSDEDLTSSDPDRKGLFSASKS